MDGIRLGILDPLTTTGRELRRLLADEDKAFKSVTLLASGEGAGTLSAFADEPVVVRPFDDSSPAELDILAFCGDGDRERDTRLWLGDSQLTLVDVAGSLPNRPGMRVWIPGAGESPRPTDRRLRAPHVASTLLGPVVAALADQAEVLRCDATLFQSVADFGEAGIDELHQQTVDVLSFRPPPVVTLGARVAFNLLPDSRDNVAAAEHRVREDLAAALGSGAPPLSLFVLRAPLFVGVALEASLELDGDFAVEDIAAILSDRPGIELVSDQPPSPGELPEGGPGAPVLVSLFGQPESGRVRVWVVGDGFKHGVAGLSATLIARLASGRV